MTNDPGSEAWTRAQWDAFVADEGLRRNIGAPPSGALPPQIEQLVARMIQAEAQSRPPGDFDRPSAVAQPFTLHERYLVCGLLGFGGQARTWLAIDQKSGQRVALKELDLGRLQQWKNLQLFEREAEVLERMDHPNVPHYVDSFKQQDGSEVTFFMAMEFIEGQTLEEELRSRGSFDVAAAAEVRDALFETLTYIHRFKPAIVHRDIKPSNLIRTPDGRLVLVDFGAVQASAAKTMGGSTVVGTSGYAPIEQFMGRAVPASDLYAVGATLVHLMAGRPPTDLPTGENRLQFEEVLQLDPSWENGLRALLEPTVEQRPQSVERAREAFSASAASSHGGQTPDAEPTKKKRSPVFLGLIVALALGLIPLVYFGLQRQKAYVDVPNIYPEKPANAKTALFIGNSHTYWGVPRYVAEMAKSAGKPPLWFDVRASPGKRLGWHVDEGAGDEIGSGDYEVVVLQPQSLEPVAYEQYFGAALAQLEAAAQQGGATSIVWMPWARDPETDVYGLYPRYGDYAKLTKSLARGVRGWANSSKVCPIGEVWASVRNDHPDIRLHSPQNGNSATWAGAYLTGLVLYHCIYAANPKEVTWKSGNIPSAQEEQLRIAAAKAIGFKDAE